MIHTQVKKNQFDPTAGYFYALGCSLIHFSMIITMFFIQYPNVEEAKKSDQLYMERIKDSSNVKSLPALWKFKTIYGEIPVVKVCQQ